IRDAERQRIPFESVTHPQGDVAQLVSLRERTGVPAVARRRLAGFDGHHPILVNFLAAPVSFGWRRIRATQFGVASQHRHRVGGVPPIRGSPKAGVAYVPGLEASYPEAESARKLAGT